MFVSFKPRQGAMIPAASTFWNTVIQSTTRGGYLGKDFAHPEKGGKEVKVVLAEEELQFIESMSYLQQMVVSHTHKKESSFRCCS